MATETNWVVTVNVLEELNPAEPPVTVVVPRASVLAKPDVLIVATAFAEELQFAVLVRSLVLPSV